MCETFLKGLRASKFNGFIWCKTWYNLMVNISMNNVTLGIGANVISWGRLWSDWTDHRWAIYIKLIIFKYWSCPLRVNDMVQILHLEGNRFRLSKMQHVVVLVQPYICLFFTMDKSTKRKDKQACESYYS